MKLLKITPRLLWGILLSMIASLLNLYLPLLVRHFINLKQFAWSGLSKKVLLLGGLILIGNLLVSSLSDYLISSEGDRQVRQLRLRLQKQVLRLPQKYFDQQISGNLTSRIINDVNVLRSFLTETIPAVVTGSLTILGTMLITFSLDWKLTLLMLLVFPIDGLVTVPLGKISEVIADQTQSSLAALTGVTSESIKQIKTVKLNKAEEDVFAKNAREINKLYRLSLKGDRIAAMIGPLQSMLSFCLIMAVVLYGTLRVKSGSLSTGTLGAFMMYFFQIIGPINNVALFYSDRKQMLGATRKISEIINETAEETAGKEQLAVAPGSSLLRLDQVSFAYQDLPVLEKVDLEARSGEKIALVGATGAGKTTLANVITRLYPVAAGRISLNGQASTDFSLEQWRGFFSVVLQENTIISGSIRDNLTLGLNRKVTDQELWDALALVRLEEYAKKLPKGLDSLLGESGKQLSGGQRQRMQIARACLRDFKFLLLDEATSNLDADTEKIIMTALDRLKRTKNCGQITIAHRLATIANSDRIYFIKNKTVVASGSHEGLLEKVPDYRRYVHEQQLKEKR
ncbi:ABC transporter ATP-binding protein [Lactobacillus delbrueckii]|uniref:ABC transporter ATP-binding protein n=1 Tax=Lactobacillus delbrueckii TaxID=1584 RepID=UPI001F2B4AEF|nr:ABC transporter ATP-binding protein [Lactobacillus delbrueckii]GHN55066.1 multidrug ABC transporter ATP-binding and permease protein [Lactobacillus delbrueckii]GHN58818.1 multidrug ABC transporter ATP-binding and permease protein [Lactobacillus delbrueckii]